MQTKKQYKNSIGFLMAKYKNQIIGIIGFSISMILIAFSHIIILELTYFGEKYISQDHKIELEGIRIIKFYLFFIILSIMVFSTVFVFNLNRKLLQLSSNYINWFEMKKFFCRAKSIGIDFDSTHFQASFSQNTRKNTSSKTKYQSTFSLWSKTH